LRFTPSPKRSNLKRIGILLLAVLAAAQERKPDVRLEGTIDGSESHNYKLLPFEVPQDVSRITVNFSYTGKDEKTALDLGIYDPRGFRGWSGGDKSHFTISETDATPSYLPGVITPGTWKLIIGIPNIRPQSKSEYHARIYFSRTLEQQLADSAFGPARRGPGWYRGDLHMHTGSSDGSCQSKLGVKVPCPLFKTLETASARKFDFVAVTDHNDVSHFQQLRELAPYYDNLLLMHGREITTFQGHANVFGTDSQIDFRVGTPEVPDMNALLREVKETGGLISINHPNAPTGEFCMGCGWTPNPPADLNLVQAVEAVNSGDSGTPYGVKFWTESLNKGFRLAGIGGSDNHNADLPETERGAIGHPTTVVYANDLSEREILAGIRAGHVFIDLQGTRDRMLELTATLGKTSARMGDNVKVQAQETIEFSLRVAHAKSDWIEVIRDGEKTDLLSAPTIASDDERRTFKVTSDGRRHWIRVTVRDQGGHTVLIGNPIYINFCCSQTVQQGSSAWLPGHRVLMDAHNCYPYEGRWSDRIRRALSAGTPLSIEQDLALYRDPTRKEVRVVVSHKSEVDGTEPTLESYFFDGIRADIEQALRKGNRAQWPLVVLNLDLKSDDAKLVRATKDILTKYRDWLTTAERGNSIDTVQPLHVGPVLVLTGESDIQRKIFFDELSPNAPVLAFGAAHHQVHDDLASPEALLAQPVSNYRRWVNFAWPIVEPEGQNRASEWTPAKETRLQSLIARAHELGYWIRFYTLDGGTSEQFKENGWLDGYNLGSLDAACPRWAAAIREGADFIASDHYEQLSRLIRTQQRGRCSTVQ
jgi:predicted metal-dependent phosphoesterase TrpH